MANERKLKDGRYFARLALLRLCFSNRYRSRSMVGVHGRVNLLFQSIWCEISVFDDSF